MQRGGYQIYVDFEQRGAEGRAEDIIEKFYEDLEGLDSFDMAVYD